MTRRFGAYEILYELKSGGMGAVLLGRRRGPGAFEQLVAIKTIRPEYASSPQVRAMFLDEAAILARLNHPGIATVHDFGEDGGTLYMVMEYVAGIPFRDFADLAPPPAIAARAVAEACRGVHAAHELHALDGTPLGVVHRDLSPDNLMLGFDGHVKVIDFGIALIKNRQAPVTELGTVKGKPPYMSPEQIQNEAMDRKSDVWALGVVLHELLARQHLFDGDSIYAVALAVAQQQLLPPSVARGEELPLGLDAVVMNALDRDQEQRTPTAAALAEALEVVLQTAAGETLEAWAARELAGARDAHRAWLAGVVGGSETAPRPGRATAEHTALAIQPGTSGAPVATPPHPVETGVAETPYQRTKPPGPRRRFMPLLLVLLLGVAAIVVVIATRHGATEAPADAVVRAPDDAVRPADTTVRPPDAPPADAVVVRVPVDSAIDAGRTVHRDAAVVVVVHPPIDAVIAPPAGTGTVDLRSPGVYRNVQIDGKPAGPTPQYKHVLSAGPHTIEFLDPETNRVVSTQHIVVERDGKSAVQP